MNPKVDGEIGQIKRVARAQAQSVKGDHWMPPAVDQYDLKNDVGTLNLYNLYPWGRGYRRLRIADIREQPVHQSNSPSSLAM